METTQSTPKKKLSAGKIFLIMIGGLIAFALLGALFTTDDPPPNAAKKAKCNDYEVIFDAAKIKHIYTENLDLDKAACIAAKLYKPEYRNQKYFFYQFKDDRPAGKWKYEIYYDADQTDLTHKDDNGNPYGIEIYDSIPN